MSLRRARTADEYVDWVRQAVFEVQDLRECLEFEMEDLARFPAYLEPLTQSVNALYKSMQDGSYSFGRHDLPFMELVHRHADQIPFQSLLKQINETHRRGLEVEEDDA